MELSEDDVDLVRASFRELALEPWAAAGLFYDRLFEIAPELRALFPTDMERQGNKMMSTLGAIVAGLHDHEMLRPMVTDLGRRHVDYGAVPDHYIRVGEALLWTLDQKLGERFTPAVREAWTRAYHGLSGIMIQDGHANGAGDQDPSRG